MSSWVDFKQIRENLDCDEVLNHYGVEVKVKGEQAQGFCPLPGHEGKRRSPSFSVNLTRRIWQCFGCGAKGNMLDFVALMEGLDPAKGNELRKAALLAQKRFSTDAGESREAATRPPAASRRRTGRESNGDRKGSVVVNAPLDFTLKGLDHQHAYLWDRGFKSEAIKHFGLGYCKRGLMAGRIAIPLHDAAGKLVGYAGRLVDDGAVNAEHPKYLLPGKREHKGQAHEFRKSLFLYHGYTIERQVDDLIVVEGFPDVWWLWQAGYQNVVGLMGASCSAEQTGLIVQAVAPDGRVWIFPDGDQAGERCAADVLVQVGQHRWVRWVKLDEGREPTDCNADELTRHLSGLKATSARQEQEQ